MYKYTTQLRMNSASEAKFLMESESFISDDKDLAFQEAADFAIYLITNHGMDGYFVEIHDDVLSMRVCHMGDIEHKLIDII